ncbi:MAG: TadE/TadG family type IV pilus assembly protein [Acidobacteriota bacterium]
MTLRWLARDDGSALVETSIACTVLLALVIGTMEMCMGLYTYHYTAQVARMATRYAMVRGSSSCTSTPNLAQCNASASDITSYVRGLGFPTITASNLNVTTTWCASQGTTPATWASCSGTTTNDPGNLVKVVVTYPYTLAVPFLSNVSFNVSSTSQAVIAQ